MKVGQKVEVLMNGKVLHVGEIIKEDELFKDIYHVGVTSTTVKGVVKQEGKKYISIFHAKLSNLRAI